MNSSKNRPEEGSCRAEELRDENATTKSTKVPGVDLNKVRDQQGKARGRNSLQGDSLHGCPRIMILKYTQSNPIHP